MSSFSSVQTGVSIFSAANCSVVAGLIPPGAKKFINDFMAGNLLKNPLTQVFDILGPELDDLIGKIDGLSGATEDLRELNENLDAMNTQLQKFQRHTNRLSGVLRDDPAYTLDQIIGVMSAYNSMKEVLKDPGETLQDNFTQGFSSLDPRIVGPFFDNFAANTYEIGRLLGEVGYQLSLSGGQNTQELGRLFSQLGELSTNISELTTTMQGFEDADKATYAAAAIALADYALANGLISSILTDPCYGGQLITNLITQPGASSQLSSLAAENGVTVEGSPVDFLSLIPSLKNRSV
jgi:prefoldin subunit 5